MNTHPAASPYPSSHNAYGLLYEPYNYNTQTMSSGGAAHAVLSAGMSSAGMTQPPQSAIVVLQSSPPIERIRTAVIMSICTEGGWDNFIIINSSSNNSRSNITIVKACPTGAIIRQIERTSSIMLLLRCSISITGLRRTIAIPQGIAVQWQVRVVIAREHIPLLPSWHLRTMLVRRCSISTT